MLRQKLSADAMLHVSICLSKKKKKCNVALKIVLKNRRVKHRLKISNDDHWQLTWLSLNAEI